MKLDSKIRFDGGTACLDLVNTIHDRTEVVLKDYLSTPADIILWARRAGIAGFSRVKKPGNKSLKKIRTLRQLLYAMFRDVKNIDQSNLNDFNDNWRKIQSHLQVRRSRNKYIEKWHFEKGDLNWILAPIVKDARDLLLSDKLSRIKSCPNCGWLFLDRTKNGKRRWCSMETCGSNVKALEWYYRHKKQ